jgi:hypothetical protein
MGRRRYTWKEQLFYAVAWSPKATVQASLSAVPLSLIEANLAGSPDYDQWLRWGQVCIGLAAGWCSCEGAVVNVPAAWLHHAPTLLLPCPCRLQDILATGIFAIIVCATLGTLAVYWLAPVLLEQEVRVAPGLLCNALSVVCGSTAVAPTQRQLPALSLVVGS